ncbi:MAG: hypothetical protein HZA78_08220 [Candidatus Schekmanbacteria bacterium]|nr:hypothetical protein [Candidatus Schekmanbacteria bacterium]
MLPDLTNQIMAELENLSRLTDEMRLLLINRGQEKDFIEVRAAGSILHDFYCGIEKIFERIAVSFDEKFPKGGNWHAELILQMTKPVTGKRDIVISEGLMNKLLLGFVPQLNLHIFERQFHYAQ